MTDKINTKGRLRFISPSLSLAHKPVAGRRRAGGRRVGARAVEMVIFLYLVNEGADRSSRLQSVSASVCVHYVFMHTTIIYQFSDLEL